MSEHENASDDPKSRRSLRLSRPLEEPGVEREKRYLRLQAPLSVGRETTRAIPASGIAKGVAVLCVAALFLCQFFYAGVMRPIFAYPAYGLLAMAGLLSLFRGISGEETHSHPAALFNAALLALWLGIGAWISPDQWQSSNFLLLTLAAFLLYLMGAWVCNTSSSRKLLVGLLLLGGTAQGLIALGQHLNLLSYVPQGWFSEQLRLWYENRQTFRLSGTYLNANHLCWFSNAMLLLALSLALFGKGNRLQRGGLILLSFLFGFTSFHTFSRGGLIALCVGLAVLVGLGLLPLFLGRAWKKGVFLLAFTTFCLLGGTAFYFSHTELPGLERLQFRDRYRQNVWQAAFERIQEHPLLGGGPGSFLYYSRAHRQGDQGSEDYYAHNDWLQIAGDFGLPALLLLMAVVVSHGRAGVLDAITRLRESRGKSFSGAVSLGATAMLAAFAVHSFFDFNLQVPANALLAALVCGMIAAFRKGFGARPRLGNRLKPAGIALGGLLLFGMLYHNRNEWIWYQAEEAFLRGAHQKAYLLACEGIASGNPHARLYRVQAEALLKRLRDDPAHAPLLLASAHDAIGRAIALAPQDRANYLRLTELLLIAGRWEEAREAAFKTIELGPLQANGYELAGRCYELQGDLRNAAWFYELSTRQWNPRDGAKRLEEVRRRLTAKKP